LPKISRAGRRVPTFCDSWSQPPPRDRGRARADDADLIARGKSEHVQFCASECVLGASGIAPVNQPQVNVNIDVKAGYVIDLSEPGQLAAKRVGGVATVIESNAVVLDEAVIDGGRGKASIGSSC
jgi:hypothetical protein